MSESTACNAVHDLLHFTHEFLLNKVVMWPTNEEQLETKALYNDIFNFPGVIGMIDGSHIEITKPSLREGL